LYQETWVDARHGRKLKLRVGEIEVEATQMSDADVLRIFELLQKKADQAQIRERLLEVNKGGSPNSR
jgi:hypothetical protein